MAIQDILISRIDKKKKIESVQKSLQKHHKLSTFKECLLDIQNNLSEWMSNRKKRKFVYVKHQ